MDSHFIDRPHRPIPNLATVVVAGLTLVLGTAADASRTDVGAVGGGTAVPEVAWALYPAGCAPPADGAVVACGEVGRYYFGPTPPPGCVEDAGSETPPVFVAPGSYQPAEPQILYPRRGAGAGGKSAAPPVPCDGGSCFEPPGGAGGDEPWLALIDWDSWHGWTTGWTMISTSAAPVHLFPLGGGELSGELGTAVGDAHLLARLCELAEGIDGGTMTPPAFLNMSLGRLAVGGQDASDAGCDRQRLSCQVGRVIDHLAAAGVVATAAAGNYHQPQFPASYASVLAAGSVDLAHLGWSGQAAASWETPALFDALLPGYGLCLGYVDGEGVERLWPVPPGSSYASAFLAGWLADTLAHHPELDPRRGGWQPQWSAAAGCWALTLDEPVNCNRPANELLSRTLGRPGDSCWSSSLEGAVTVDVEGVVPEWGVTAGTPSLVEWVEERHLPTPESDPCVPCVTDGFDNSFTTDPVRSRPGARELDRDLVIDLSRSSPIRPFLEIETLYLRVEDAFYPLLESADPGHATALDAVTEARAEALVVSGGRDLIGDGEQPSLLFVLCNQPTDCMWMSVPVLSLE